MQFYFQFRLSFYVRKIFNQLFVLESLTAGIVHVIISRLKRITKQQTQISSSLPALYFPYNCQSECQLDPYGLLVTLEQHGFELCWVRLYSASLHQLRSSLQDHTVEVVELEDREEPCICTVGTYGGPTMSYTQNLQRMGPPRVVQGPN